jgi:hypothetical protein
LNAILVSIESIVGWFLSSLGIVIEYFECIPLLGALVRWLLNLVTAVVWTIVSFWDVVAGLVGIRPEKILRVCPVILSDEKGVPVASLQNMVAVLQLACNVYKRDANVRIVPSRPFHYATGFAGPETVTADWVIVSPLPRDPELLGSAVRRHCSPRRLVGPGAVVPARGDPAVLVRGLAARVRLWRPCHGIRGSQYSRRERMLTSHHRFHHRHGRNRVSTGKPAGRGSRTGTCLLPLAPMRRRRHPQ